jgi:catechol 2,3-dioxygenase-like lactoylglutathione lyase family enzyme
MPDRHSLNSLLLSSRAQRATSILLAASAIFSLVLLSRVYADPVPAPERPRIMGIGSVTILSTNLPAANDFYREVIYPESVCKLCGYTPRRFFGFPTGQKVELLEASPSSSNLLSEISFVTEDLAKLRKFLEASGIKDEERKSRAGSSRAPLVTHDPEGHRISFAESPYMSSTRDSASAATLVSPVRIIHAGFVVHDRAAEDKFYKDILGFHVYWHGGMKEGEDKWVDMQVPDGTDWIEYMLNVPENATHKQLGVMNHIALGVPDIHAAREQLVKNGWTGTEEPKIGRDGKWQLNLYDPDETRVELMEFKPTKEPCCSAYTGPHPGAAQQ